MRYLEDLVIGEERLSQPVRVSADGLRVWKR